MFKRSCFAYLSDYKKNKTCCFVHEAGMRKTRLTKTHVFPKLFCNGSQFFISLCLWEQLFFICLPFCVENSSFSVSYLLLLQFTPKWSSYFKKDSLVRLLFKYKIGLIKSVLWRIYVKAGGISIAWSQLYQKHRESKCSSS